jgi:hypothetical protein
MDVRLNVLTEVLTKKFNYFYPVQALLSAVDDFIVGEIIFVVDCPVVVSQRRLGEQTAHRKIVLRRSCRMGYRKVFVPEIVEFKYYGKHIVMWYDNIIQLQFLEKGLA